MDVVVKGRIQELTLEYFVASQPTVVVILIATFTLQIDIES